MNSYALFLLMPLAVLVERVAKDPYRVNHFLLEYTVFLAHALSSVFDRPVLTAFAPVAVTSFVLYWTTRMYQRTGFVVLSVGVFVPLASVLGPEALLTLCLTTLPCLVTTGCLLAFTVHSSCARLVVYLLLLAACGGACLHWEGARASEGLALALALALCPRERAPVPFTPVEQMLAGVMDDPELSEDDDTLSNESC